jgi:hypothetical protein
MNKVIGWMMGIVAVGLSVQAMQFSDDFEGYAVGDLSAATTNWVAAPWDIHFDVIDDGGDKKVQHDGGNNHTMVAVNPDLFTLQPGEDMAITNVFSSGSSGWMRGVFFNYTQTGTGPAATYDLYAVYITPDGGQLAVKMDKWIQSSGTGSVITNLMSATGLGATSLMAGDGVMVVTYDADTQTIGIDVSIDGDFSFSTNMVDHGFAGGMVGLYGKAATGYAVEGFTASGSQDADETAYIKDTFVDDFEAYAAGDLSKVSSNWSFGTWDIDFDVVDSSGDKVVQHNDNNRIAMVPVDASVFAVESGDSLVITNRFSSNQNNWLHGVAFNYSKEDTSYSMYTAYLTRGGNVNREIFVNLDRWDGAPANGSTNVTSLFSVGTGAGNWDLLNTNGVMVVSYNADTAEINVQISMESGFWFGKSVTDSVLDSGQVGLFGKLSGDYVVSEFSAALLSDVFPPPVLDIVPMAGGVVKLVVDMNQAGNLSDYAPVVRGSLTSGGWAAVAHSDNGSNSFVETNLTYSTVEASNRVIYVQSTDAVGFFVLQ